MQKNNVDIQKEIPDLTPALGVWAKRNNVTPIKFSRAMNWSYTYAYGVIRNKPYKFVPAAWGEFVLAFGLKALEDLFKIAGVNPNGGEG